MLTLNPRPMPRPPSRGLTLLELMAALAVLAVLATIALPSFSSLLQRHRLGAAAEALAGDLREARFEAARSGQPLHLQTQQSEKAGWCWTVSRQPGCGCATAPNPGPGLSPDRSPDPVASCDLKTVRANDHPGIALLQPVQARMEPQGQAGQVAQAELGTRDGQRLRVVLTALGRSHICVPRAATVVSRYPAC